MPVKAHSQQVAGPFHLFGSQRPQIGAGLGSDIVLPTLTAGRTGVGQVDAIAQRQRCKHA
jgi:hypothetical protein